MATSGSEWQTVRTVGVNQSRHTRNWWQFQIDAFFHVIQSCLVSNFIRAFHLVFQLMLPRSSVERLSFAIGGNNCSILRLTKPEFIAQLRFHQPVNGGVVFESSARCKVGVGQQTMGCLLSAEPSRDDHSQAGRQAGQFVMDSGFL